MCLNKSQNTLNIVMPEWNSWHYAFWHLEYIFLEERRLFWFIFHIHFHILCSVHNGPTNNKSSLVQVMAQNWKCDKPLPEPMMTSSMTYMWFWSFFHKSPIHWIHRCQFQQTVELTAVWDAVMLMWYNCNSVFKIFLLFTIFCYIYELKFPSNLTWSEKLYHINTLLRFIASHNRNFYIKSGAMSY